MDIIEYHWISLGFTGYHWYHWMSLAQLASLDIIGCHISSMDSIVSWIRLLTLYCLQHDKHLNHGLVQRLEKIFLSNRRMVLSLSLCFAVQLSRLLSSLICHSCDWFQARHYTMLFLICIPLHSSSLSIGASQSVGLL